MTKSFETPTLAVDVIVEIEGKIVLIERKYPPHGWAIPGGMVDVGEKLEDAACREIQEETGLDVTLECLLSVYSAPERDPRRHVVSVVYVGQAEGAPKADDDAKNAQLFAIDELPALLAFDHQHILTDYRVYRETGAFPPPRPSSK